MIVGHHLIWTTYGSWLPNDPRGSSSHEIRVPVLIELGELHHGRKKIQPAGKVIRAFYADAHPLLQYQTYLFTDEEITLLGDAFTQTIQQHRYTCYACAIMPDHVHMLIRRHRDFAEAMIEHFQQESREALIAAGKRPAHHPVWGGPGWKVFQDCQNDVVRTECYVRTNPEKARRPPQRWSFAQPYNGWLPPMPCPYRPMK